MLLPYCIISKGYLAFFEVGPVCLYGVFDMWSQQTTRDQPQNAEVQEFVHQMKRFIAKQQTRWNFTYENKCRRVKHGFTKNTTTTLNK